MDKEYETQILDIDKDNIVKKLQDLGAAEEPEVLQKRWVFDIEPCTTKSTGEWIRLRQVADKKPTITYKNKSGKGISDTTEIEIEVDDFDTAYKLLDKIMPTTQFYQENKRHKFVLDQVEYTLDSWPMIPTLMEIEAKSEEKVHEALELLGLTGKDEGHIGTLAIYDKYGIALHSMKELKF